jgi:CheY-like chemotaxis protein
MKKLLSLPSLKARLVFWFTAICLIPLALMTTIIYFQRVKVVREQIFDKLSAISSLRQQQINSLLDTVAVDASTLAIDHSVALAAAQLTQDSRSLTGGAAQALTLLRGYAANAEAVADVSIVSRTGAVLLSTAEGKQGRSVAKPECVASALRDQVPTYGEAYLHGADGVPSMEVAAPIKSSGSEALPAVLLVRYDLRKLLYDFVENRSGLGKSGETLLVNRDTVSLSELRGIPHSVLRARLKGRPSQLAAQGQTGIAETADYRGVKVLAAYAFIPRTGWGLVSKQDADEVYEPVVSLLLATYGLAAIISLLVCFFALRLARSISQPIIDLSSTAARIGAGDYGARIAPTGTEEHVALAHSFNSMADALQLKIAAQQGLALISENLVMADNLSGFFGKLLPVLMSLTGARMAVAFMDEEQGEYFLPVHSIGADSSKMRRFSRHQLEGELGVILSSRSVSHFCSVDAAHPLRFVTAYGEVTPAEIITVPIFLDEEIRAFVSVASERPFPRGAHDTLQQAMLPISAGFARVLAGDYVRRLAEELSAKNAELTQQSEELVQQSTELAQQSDELSRRNQTLDKQKQQLEQATRLKSEFLSNMSHELRTPLNSVLALSRVLFVQGGGRLTEDERGYLSIIERNGKHLLSLINDILDLAKIESGRQDVFYDAVSLEKVAAEVVDSLLPIAREKGIDLQLSVEGPLPQAFVDAKRLRQILQNLVGNAVKFTVRGGVAVQLNSRDGEFTVQVADTGIGIAPESLDSIFQEFRQADGSTSRSFEGTGLGLAIVRKTALLLGGDVRVQSEQGRGSTFTLRLPLDGRAKKGEANRPAGLPAPSQPKAFAQTVLVVDDDPESVALIASHLAQAGYETVTALNGADAVRLARASRPFAITLDIMMPEMDGWEVMRELKCYPETTDIPVIIVSLSDDRETGVALGAIGVIAKPVDKAQLTEQLAKLTGVGCRLVLVVDDSEHDRFFIASIFKEHGMDVLLAENGPQALELALTDHPDLITLDLMMPGMDGAQVLDQLRSYQATSAIPVVVITSKDLSAEESARLSLGVSAVLSKGGYDRQAMLDDLVKSLGNLGWRLPQAPSARGSRILIVEDSEAATIQLRFALDSEGISVDAVSGGRHALDYLKTHVPDGIILDLMMPEVDGFAVLQAVRNCKLTEKVPVMIMTAKTLSPGEYDRLRELDVSHLLQKGDVDQQELLRRVYEMLGVVRLFKDEEAPRATRPAAVPGLRQGDGSLLVVEDNPDNLAIIRAVLSDSYRIIEALDGEAGVAAARSGSPSLILLDMQLPRMDGMEVLRRLQDESSTAGIPVVALTASAMSGDRERFLEAGCVDYLSKPYQVSDLVAVVERYLEAGSGESRELGAGD